MIKNLIDKFERTENPRRILSLDGGGIRGTLTLGILKEIERLVKEKQGQETTLGDYYDLICGTSTGAIIACGLAIGKSVDEVIKLYLDLGGEIFGKGRKWKIVPRDWTSFRAIFNESYSSDNLETYLKKEFGEITIGDTQLIKCGLAINSKRADTYSLWTVANHPNGKYYKANSHLKLWELCRASSAAPYYFKPKILNLKTRKGEAFDSAFIDGGVSLANNPAWISFLTATVGTFGFKWNTGVDNILITTIGTGNGLKKENPKDLQSLKALSWASKLSDLFMTDALEMNQILLEGIGKNAGSTYFIDSQFSDADKAFEPQFRLKEQLFSFDRHNVILTSENLKKLGFQYDDDKFESLKEMDHFENMEDLLAIGKKYALNTKFNLI
jgi:patatin-like phospholipase/acyl hydrolase